MDDTLKVTLDTAEAKAAEKDAPSIPTKIKELHRYLAVGSDLPNVLTHDDPQSVQAAQRVLQRCEAYLDRVLAIQFEARTVLQAMENVATVVIRELVRHDLLSEKASGPVEQRTLVMHVPTFCQIRRKWELLESLCGDVQKRLGGIRKTVDLMQRLDDNLRWAQYRQPS